MSGGRSITIRICTADGEATDWTVNNPDLVTFSEGLVGTFNEGLVGTFNEGLVGTFNEGLVGTFNESTHQTFYSSYINVWLDRTCSIVCRCGISI